MATIIENNDASPRPVLVSQDNSAGWAIAVLVLLAILAVGAFWFMRYRAPAGSTVQVNLPSAGYAPSDNTGNTNNGAQTGGGAGTQTSAPQTQAPATAH